MYIYIVRHGFTTWNGDGKLQGKLDTDLSDIGRTQGKILGERLKNCPIKKIYSSPLKRAYETATIINSYLNVPIERAENLMEMSFGEWEGLTWDHIVREHPHYITWNNNRFLCRTPGGESYKDTLDRSMKELKNICNSNTQDILIVSHGALIRTLICGILSLDIDNGYKLHFDNCGITILEFDKDKESFLIKTLNDLSHFPNK